MRSQFSKTPVPNSGCPLSASLTSMLENFTNTHLVQY